MVTKSFKTTFHCLVILMLSIFSVHVYSEDEFYYKNRIEVDGFFSDDTDDQKYQKVLGGYDYLFSKKEFVGARIGKRKYSEEITDEERTFDELEIRARYDFSEMWYTLGSISVLDNENWSPALFSLEAYYIPSETWKLNFYTNREIIDTVTAVDDKNTLVTVGAAVDYEISQQHVLIANISTGEVDDDNKRNALTLAYVWNPEWLSHASFKLEGKNRTYDFNSPNYFSPDKHEQYFALLRLSMGLGDKQYWLFRFEGGPGVQYIDDERESAVKYKLELSGPLDEQIDTRLSYGCTSDGGVDDYEYCYGEGSLSYKW